jgi:hypothetical protein
MGLPLNRAIPPIVILELITIMALSSRIIEIFRAYIQIFEIYACALIQYLIKEKIT